MPFALNWKEEKKARRKRFVRDCSCFLSKPCGFPPRILSPTAGQATALPGWLPHRLLSLRVKAAGKQTLESPGRAGREVGVPCLPESSFPHQRESNHHNPTPCRPSLPSPLPLFHWLAFAHPPNLNTCCSLCLQHSFPKLSHGCSLPSVRAPLGALKGASSERSTSLGCLLE